MERSGRDTGGSHCAEILLRGDSRHGQVHEVGRPAGDWDRGEDLMSSDWEKAGDGGTSGGVETSICYSPDYVPGDSFRGK